MKPTLVINPRTDSVFVTTVETESQAAPAPVVLEERLRAVYPNASVRPRQLEGERHEVWYVYRDGRWVPST